MRLAMDISLFQSLKGFQRLRIVPVYVAAGYDSLFQSLKGFQRLRILALSLSNAIASVSIPKRVSEA